MPNNILPIILISLVIWLIICVIFTLLYDKTNSRRKPIYMIGFLIVLMFLTLVCTSVIIITIKDDKDRSYVRGDKTEILLYAETQSIIINKPVVVIPLYKKKTFWNSKEFVKYEFVREATQKDIEENKKGK